MGLRLRWVNDGIHDLCWHDILTIVEQSPRLSAMVRHLSPEVYTWGLQEKLLASILHAIQSVSWQIGGGKGERPQPIHFAESHESDSEPSEEQDPFLSADGSGVFKGEAASIDEINEFLGW